MFTAKRLADGAVLYRSRMTGKRYVIAATRFGLKLYIEGMAILTNASTTRRDLFDAIEYHEAFSLR